MDLETTSRFVRVAPEGSVPVNGVKVFQVKDRRVLICNVDGKLYAIDDRCTHDNGPLGEGELFGCEVECPRHGARFDVRTGEAKCLPAVGAVHKYSVDVVDGEIYVGLPIDEA